MNNKKIKVGILGGSFDPAHKGHLAISKEAKKRFNLERIIWAITKKNPFKAESETLLSKRIKDCKEIIGTNSFIKVRFYENVIKSNKTIDLINHLKKNKDIEIYFLMGADYLINFHKWQKSESISKKCNIVVFDTIPTVERLNITGEGDLFTGNQTLTAGETKTVAYKYQTSAKDGTQIENTATVTTNTGLVVTDTAITTLGGFVDLVINKEEI